MLVISKLREAIICLKNLRVTLPYPAQPAIPADGFRGRIKVDIDKCIGCGACINACPPRLISMVDQNSRRRIEFTLGRCTYCGRCADICPEKAILMTKEFELSTDDKKDLDITAELFMAKCLLCGTAFTTQRIVDKLLSQIPKEIGIDPAALEGLKHCPSCRKLHEAQNIGDARI
jgi:hydrogenase-4 component H